MDASRSVTDPLSSQAHEPAVSLADRRHQKQPSITLPVEGSAPGDDTAEKGFETHAHQLSTATGRPLETANDGSTSPLRSKSVPVAALPLSSRSSAAYGNNKQGRTSPSRARSPPALQRPTSPTTTSKRASMSSSSPSRPLSPRNRAAWTSTSPNHVQATSEGPTQDSLDKFALLCRQLYFDKSAAAAQTIDATLSRLPPSHRTPFAKVMASVRAQFHREEEDRRRRLVNDTLTSLNPGQVVRDVLRVQDGVSTRAMRSPIARQLRSNRLKSFIDEHCIKAMPGTHPFFKSLYCALWLQARAQDKGGAGSKRVAWDVDVAVFCEASAGSWMKDSIELLKGVLGCSESPLPNAQKSPASPLELVVSLPPASRDRSTSDPFLDPGDRVMSAAKNVSLDPLTPPSPVSPAPIDSPLLVPPVSPTAIDSALEQSLSQRAAVGDIRVFTLPPYLTDPELLALTRLFPDYITTRTRLAAFVDVDDEDIEVTKLGHNALVGSQARLPKTNMAKVGAVPGHGIVRVTENVRDHGWRGTLFERFILWLLQLFRLA
ncbi:hypothetical protein OIO90_003433 [Microbotryomycetes sp. JL221]|nr:hypothetical protein OIO90_003433 [Microbotryomycetes sp. JL221]